MNIQLFLENQEVELNNKIAFPLNKTFENLWNPTDIIVEYSKSINVPATAANNKLMANAYRLDRQYIVGGDTNIGMYLDPMKRIPMKLIYNGTILLDGYAKYTSATSNGTSTYYTFNLYGALGDVFQTLLDCVFDENKLTEEQLAEDDGGMKYVIETPWEKRIINKDFVKDSWDYTTINFDYDFYPFNSIGFAPAYRGNYDDFEANSIMPSALEVDTVVTEPWSVEEYLKKRWRSNLISDRDYTAEEADTRIDALNFDIILPKGLNEHNMRQFRSYEQKPYIYFHALMKMYQKKCKELTGYTINLDPSWFSVNNPYWSKICYMLDYLSVKGNTLQTSQPFTGYHSEPWDNFPVTSVSYDITDSNVLSQGDITTLPFTICLQNKFTPFSGDANPAQYGHVGINKNVEIYVDITTTVDGTATHTYFWGGLDYASAGSSIPNKYTKNNFITLSEQDSYDSDANKVVGKTFMTIPGFTIPHTTGKDLSITYKITVNRHYVAGSTYSFHYSYDGTHRTYIHPQSGNDDFIVIIPNTEYATNWRNTTTCEMKNLYSKDESLFNVILQYTKMFGLIWKPDYNKKTIDIMTRQSYFKDYKIVDWSDRIDKSKGMTIEPVSFASKYINFNYGDVDGYRYSGYKNKYGVEYGEKKIKTKYNFDTKTTDLFKDIKINPSSASCKSYVPINTLTSWDTISTLVPTPSEVDFIDSEDDNEESSITINNWYFRMPNYTSESWYKIADVSQAELQNGKYFWLSNARLEAGAEAVNTQTLPCFSPVYKTETGMANMIGTPVGCLFTCPNEDHTKTKLITEANGNYIYDICWADYINERYNANNKKVTCYIKITPTEFEQFNFKTFVVIDNQLFTVNKVVDFDVKNNITKMELIQVTNIKGYTEQKLQFPAIAYDKTAINITTQNGYGSASIQFTSYPTLSYGDWEITPVNAIANSNCFTEGGDIYDGITYDMSVVYESDGNYTEEWKLTVNALGETIEIPIYIN